MRSDWVQVSASALVIGAMSLVLGTLVNPVRAGQDAGATLRVVESSGGRWLAMAVMFFIASITLSLGLPAVLSLFEGRGRVTGLVAVSVFAVGTIGLSGYAMLMVFFRALVETDALKVSGAGLEQVTRDAGMSVFLFGWIACFYAGVVLLMLALFVARRTPTWVPVLFLVFLLLSPFASSLGRVGGAVQILAFAIALTGVAVSAATPSTPDPRLPAF
jgi:hypothetical protein